MAPCIPPPPPPSKNGSRVDYLPPTPVDEPKESRSDSGLLPWVALAYFTGLF